MTFSGGAAKPINAKKKRGNLSKTFDSCAFKKVSFCSLPVGGGEAKTLSMLSNADCDERHSCHPPGSRYTEINTVRELSKLL